MTTIPFMPAPSLAAQQDAPGNRLLVIDDDRVQRAVIGRIATQAGYIVDSAPSFDEAIDMLASHDYAFITLDLSLGDRDGVEVLRDVGARGLATPIVVVSGCDERILKSTVRMAESLSLNVIETLPKPIDLGRLREALTNGRVRSTLPAPAAAPPAITAEELRAAIEGGEIQPAFQPKIELTSGRVVGCEALARWFSPRHGAVGPEIFVPLVEQHGLMDAMTELLIESALRNCRDIVAAQEDFSVAVNTPPTLLYDLDFPERVEKILLASGLAPHNLTLEITESVAMADVQRANDILLRLRIKGIGISIDDFGTGHSSLAALARMPFSELKIDRTFVARGPDDPDMWKIVCASIALARHFGMRTVAEGVETAAIAQALATQGCDMAQGFYFAPALDAMALASWIDDWHAAHKAPTERQMSYAG